MWESALSGRAMNRIRLASVTNGIHTAGWTTATAHQFWTARLGENRGRSICVIPGSGMPPCTRRLSVGPKSFGRCGISLRRELIEVCDESVFMSRISGTAPGTRSPSIVCCLPDVLTIGFCEEVRDL